MIRDAVISFPMFGESFAINPPASYQLFGRTFYWYGAIIAIGFLLAVFYCMRRSRQFGISSDNVIDMLIIAVPLAIVGARLYYVIFNFADFFSEPISVFKIWEGGLAIYGGIIGAVIGAIISCRWKKIPVGAMLDLGGLGLLIGQFVGRFANFINREAFGPETEVIWRMGLYSPATGETVYVHPTFIYESLWNLVGFIILHIFSQKGKRKYDGQLFLMYVAWYGLGRMFIESLRTDSLYIAGTPIRVSQLLAGLSLAAALIIMFVNAKYRKLPDLWVNRNPAYNAGDPETEKKSAQEAEELE